MSDTDQVKIHGLSVKLDEAREVLVGKWPGEENSYAVRFVNGETVTRMRLSGQAIEALYELYRDVSGANKVQQWVVVAPTESAPLSTDRG